MHRHNLYQRHRMLSTHRNIPRLQPTFYQLMDSFLWCPCMLDNSDRNYPNNLFLLYFPSNKIFTNNNSLTIRQHRLVPTFGFNASPSVRVMTASVDKIKIISQSHLIIFYNPMKLDFNSLSDLMLMITFISLFIIYLFEDFPRNSNFHFQPSVTSTSTSLRAFLKAFFQLTR